jgi:hypothetical protein
VTIVICQGERRGRGWKGACFTVSRSFGKETPGVIGADLSATVLDRFLREQRITRASAAYIFTKKKVRLSRRRALRRSARKSLRSAKRRWPCQDRRLG